MSKISNSQPIRKERSVLFIMLVLLSFIAVTALVHEFINPRVEKVEIARWYDDHTAAYSIIHDDLCLDDCFGIIEFADTIAYNRNVKVGMGASVGACYENGDTLWPKLRQIVEHGHELIAHSWNHGAAVDLGWTPLNWSNDSDVVLSKQILEDSVPGADVNFFIFPFDAYNDERIASLKEAGYLGARAGSVMYQDRGINRSAAEYDPLRTIFDAYMSKEEQDMVDSSDNPYTTSIYDDDKGCVAVQHLDAAIMTRGWSLQELHSVDDRRPMSWGQIAVEDYRNLLNHAVKKRENGELWIETPTTVAKYFVTRKALKDISMKGTKLGFTGGLEDERYKSPVTLRFETRNEPDSLFVWQSGKKIAAEKRGVNLFVLNVDSFEQMIYTFR